jgi:hypothetical protein
MKMPHVREDVARALDELKVLPGVPIGTTVSLVPGIDHQLVLKVRVASTDLQRGKRGAIRMLLVHCGNQEWQCVVAYAKTQIGDLPRAEILKAIREEMSP